MSDNVGFHLTRDDVDDTSKDLIAFCMQLVHHSQWKFWRKFMCGSSVENPCLLRIAEDNRIPPAMLDVDQMIYSTFCYALNRSVSLSETYTGEIIRIYTDDVHAGYARLIREKDNAELLLSDLCKMNDMVMKHGPALLMDNEKDLLSLKHSLSCESMDAVEYGRHIILFHDIVFAVHNPYWPVEATEWIIRRRTHDFPSKSVFKQIIRYGCDFVQVSHNRLRNDNEWRFSFSKAELFIIESWSISQRIVYSTLWVLNKKIASSYLCSYYFKTLMLWACEEKSSQFWSDELIADTVCELIIVMLKWVKCKFCVNYFIRGNNMMDHLIDKDLSYEIDALWRTFQSRQLISEAIGMCGQHELLVANRSHRIELPAWIKRAFVIYRRVNNVIDNYTDLLSTVVATDLQNSLYVELSGIYKGLCFQQKSVSCANKSDEHIYSLKSESHLLFAVNLCQSQERDAIDNCSEKFVQLTMQYFKIRDTDVFSRKCDSNIRLNTKPRSTYDRQKSLNDQNERKHFLYSRSVAEHENKLVNNYWNEEISEKRIVNIAVHSLIEIMDITGNNVLFYQDWPGRSPTVNISWFIATAYLANLYYTTQRDVSLTLKTCDDIIRVSRQSQMNELFAELTFPVVLSTQWTSIYDPEIQELLGFYSLCSFVFDSSSRSVYLSVCPVQFALYLKLRIMCTLSYNLWTVRYDKKKLTCSALDIIKCYNDCCEHSRACQRNDKVIKGSIRLKIASDLFQFKLIKQKKCSR